MKNFIISILAMQIITGMDFWEFSGNDRLFIGFVMVFLLFAIIDGLEGCLARVRKRRMLLKRRSERFAQTVNELTKGKVS